MNKTCIILAGPTAVGKTALAIPLAQHFSTAVISADSRQCYRELDIGVAKPTPAELQLVPHYFINTHSIFDEVTAAGFAEYALETIYELFRKHDVVLMTGGTGLYLRAFMFGLDPVPPADPLLRKQLNDQFLEHGVLWLQLQLQELDPAFLETDHQQNPHRLLRALEVVKLTGKPIRSFHSGIKAKRDFHIVPVALELPRKILYERIENRVTTMMKSGLLAEAENLFPHQKLNALQTVGYRELFAFFEGKCTLDEAISAIRQNTRHYAKRQLTWFRRETDYHWMAPDFDTVLAYIASKI
jgi:tRNA dimethylallyltransferase